MQAIGSSTRALSVTLCLFAAVSTAIADDLSTLAAAAGNRLCQRRLEVRPLQGPAVAGRRQGHRGGRPEGAGDHPPHPHDPASAGRADRPRHRAGDLLRRRPAAGGPLPAGRLLRRRLQRQEHVLHHAAHRMCARGATTATSPCRSPSGPKSSSATTRTRTLMNYSYVEWESLPEWNAALGYFHATYRRKAFPLDQGHRGRRSSRSRAAGHLLGPAVQRRHR